MVSAKPGCGAEPEERDEEPDERKRQRTSKRRIAPAGFDVRTGIFGEGPPAPRSNHSRPDLVVHATTPTSSVVSLINECEQGAIPWLGMPQM